MARVLLNDDNDDPTRVIELLASRLERMARENWVLSVTPPPVGCWGKRTVFDGPAEPTKQLDPLVDYLQHFQLEIECMASDYVQAGIYVERFLSANPSVPLTYSNVHRLVLAGLVFAVKSYKIHIGNERFGPVGQITTNEMFDIEEALFNGIDVDSYNVDTEAIDEYCTLLLCEEEEAESHSASSPPSHSASPPLRWRPMFYKTPTPPLPPRLAPSSSQSAPSSASTSTSTTAPPTPPTDDSCFICKFCGRFNSSA